jgi:hypothetical protein
MMKSGIEVMAQRKDARGSVNWMKVDIIDLSDEEFATWWITIQDDKDKFHVANSLRKLAEGLSDYGDQDIP